MSEQPTAEHAPWYEGAMKAAGLILCFYGAARLIFRVLVLSNYDWDLGWGEFTSDFSVSAGALIAGGAIFGVALLASTQRLRDKKQRSAQPVTVRDAPATPEWVEISMAEFDAIAGELKVMIRGDGRDELGRPTSIVRYECPQTGAMFERVYEASGTRVWQLRPAEPGARG